MEVPVKALIIIYIILFFLVLFAYFLLIMSLAQGPSWLGYPGAWLRHRGLDWAADLLPSFPGLAPGSLADQPLENLS